ncbi:hypothetical protein TRFO_38033 [Tritrichomonas foetus]|uniref:Protein kinase domain-containing protein n=1 Tax=Tritrichomonas foetus TaxID=1144522 RepID=A0A1J4JDS6_9EUKA|nr:hypothetical protein TRFO_38033 [Tritrichomonas foetus]|eukprot:OHS95827.1 hypothetical protein TRFO_38033 [Tritrichomonas foetus]
MEFLDQADFNKRYLVVKDMSRTKHSASILVQCADTKKLFICKIISRKGTQPGFIDSLHKIVSSKIPNVCAYNIYSETDQNYYLIRPYIQRICLSDAVAANSRLLGSQKPPAFRNPTSSIQTAKTDDASSYCEFDEKKSIFMPLNLNVTNCQLPKLKQINNNLPINLRPQINKSKSQQNASQFVNFHINRKNPNSFNQNAEISQNGNFNQNIPSTNGEARSSSVLDSFQSKVTANIACDNLQNNKNDKIESESKENSEDSDNNRCNRDLDFFEVWKTIVSIYERLHSFDIHLNSIKLSNFFIIDERTIDMVDVYPMLASSFNGIETPDPKCFIFYAPEVFTHEMATSQASDMWSLGAILMYCCGFQLPWSTVNMCSMIRTITACDFEITQYNDMPNEIYEALTKLLVRDPTQRATAEDILTFFPRAAKQPKLSIISKLKRSTVPGSFQIQQIVLSKKLTRRLNASVRSSFLPPMKNNLDTELMNTAL